MNKTLMTAMMVMAGSLAAQAQVHIGVSIGAPPYYGYPSREVGYVERYVPAYDMPRVFVVSRYAGVAPLVVVNLYRRGWGWDRICGHYGVPREAFYGPYGPGQRFYGGPPYGKAFGHYKKFKHHGRRGDD